MFLTLTFLLFISFLVTVLIAYFLSAMALFPPWYEHVTDPSKGRFKLTEGMPRYKVYRGIVDDPKTNFGKDYVDVSFPSTQNGV